MPPWLKVLLNLAFAVADRLDARDAAARDRRAPAVGLTYAGVKHQQDQIASATSFKVAPALDRTPKPR